MLRGLTLLVLALAAGGPRPLSAADPLDTVRMFCRLDGRGDRLRAHTWPNVAPLVAWALEPAWDHVRLIDGYELGPPRWEDEEAVVDVTYVVSADVGPGTVTKVERRERHVYRLAHHDAETHWRLLGPPPPPHVFAIQVDAEAMAASLDPQREGFLSASALAWHLMIGAGWNVPYLPTVQLAGSDTLSAIPAPEPGDVVLYYDGDEPYHVGVMEADGVVVSATVNAGVRRTPLDAFAGAVRYRRVAAERRGSTPSATTAARAPLPRTPRPGATRTPASSPRQAQPDAQRRATRTQAAR